jgi:K+-sensing histidine kinase KdpD
MGLAIARSVIEAHGGRLTVEPCSPAGTAFVIHLPFIGDAGGETAHQSGTSLTRHLPTSSAV